MSHWHINKSPPVLSFAAHFFSVLEIRLIFPVAFRFVVDDHHTQYQTNKVLINWLMVWTWARHLLMISVVKNERKKKIKSLSRPVFPVSVSTNLQSFYLMLSPPQPSFSPALLCQWFLSCQLSVKPYKYSCWVPPLLVGHLKWWFSSQFAFYTTRWNF